MHEELEVRPPTDFFGLLVGRDDADLVLWKDALTKLNEVAMAGLSDVHVGNARVTALC